MPKKRTVKKQSAKKAAAKKPKEVFPAAHERLRRAAATIEPGTPAQPFIEALADLVQAPADTTGFVGLHQWVEILEQHFPPEFPDPDHTTE